MVRGTDLEASYPQPAPRLRMKGTQAVRMGPLYAAPGPGSLHRVPIPMYAVLSLANDGRIPQGQHVLCPLVTWWSIEGVETEQTIVKPDRASSDSGSMPMYCSLAAKLARATATESRQHPIGALGINRAREPAVL